MSILQKTSWKPDVMSGFEQITLSGLAAPEGTVDVVLVRRRCAQDSRQAVLYVHGYVDYFFQTHLADFYNAAGLNFYAIDLRRHGRSLREGQLPNYTSDIDDMELTLYRLERAAEAAHKARDRVLELRIANRRAPLTLDKGRAWLIGIVALGANVSRQITMLIPSAMIELNEAHAALSKTAGEKAVRGIGSWLARFWTITIKDRCWFFGKIG